MASSEKSSVKNMRTPLSRVLHLGSAGSGTGDHIRQRVTAMAIAPLALVFLVGLVCLTGADYVTARSWIANPVVGILALGLVVATVMHMRVGIQIVIEDYVHGAFLRPLTMIANTFFSYGVGLACIYAVIRIGFSA